MFFSGRKGNGERGKSVICVLVRYSGNQQTHICASKSTSDTHNLQRAEAWARSEIATFRHSYIVVNTQKAGFSSLWRFPAEITPSLLQNVRGRNCQVARTFAVGAAREILNLFSKEQRREQESSRTRPRS